MNEKRDCKIVQDLLPNYIDKLTSEESNEYINEHIKFCSECKKTLEDMKEEINTDSKENDKRKIDYMKKVKNKLGTIHIIKTAFFTTFFLFIVTIIGYFIYLYSDGIVNKSNPMTREEVIALLEEGAKNTNYYRRPTDIYNTVDSGGEYFTKDGKTLTSVYGNPFIWTDANSKEQILFITKETSGAPNYEQMLDKALITRINVNTENELTELAIGITDYEKYDFKYVGEKTIDGKEYIIVKTYYKDDNFILKKLSRAKIYIDKEQKVVQMIEGVNFDKIFASKILNKFYVKLNCVTDEEIARPDLTEYEVVDWKKVQEQGSDE